MIVLISRLLAITFAVLVCLGLVLGQSGQRVSRLRPIQQDGKWRYIDSSGKTVFKPEFAWAEEFSAGLPGFEDEYGKHGYMDETGKIFIEPKFDSWTEYCK